MHKKTEKQCTISHQIEIVVYKDSTVKNRIAVNSNVRFDQKARPTFNVIMPNFSETQVLQPYALCKKLW